MNVRQTIRPFIMAVRQVSFFFEDTLYFYTSNIRAYMFCLSDKCCILRLKFASTK